MLFDEPQQMRLRNLIFQAEVVEQRFGTVVLPHHDQQASENEIQQSMARKFSFFYHAFAAFSLLITVTFSTPTGVITQNLVNE